MVAIRLDGKALAARVRADVAVEVAELGDLGLATILVGDDPASQIYIRLKHKAAGEVGAALGLAAGNVRVIRHRALGKLRACLSGEKS